MKIKLKSNLWIYSTLAVLGTYFCILLIHKLIFFIEWPILNLSELIEGPSTSAYWLWGVGDVSHLGLQSIIEEFTINFEYYLFSSSYLSKFDIGNIMNQVGFYLAILPISWIYFYEKNRNLVSLKLIRQSASHYFNKQLFLVIVVPLLIQIFICLMDYGLTYLFYYEGPSTVNAMLQKLEELNVDTNMLLKMTGPLVFTNKMFQSILTLDNYHLYYWMTMLTYGVLMSCYSAFTYLCSILSKSSNLFITLGVPLLINSIVEVLIVQIIHSIISEEFMQYGELINVVVVIFYHIVINSILLIIIKRRRQYV